MTKESRFSMTLDGNFVDTESGEVLTRLEMADILDRDSAAERHSSTHKSLLSALEDLELLMLEISVMDEAHLKLDEINPDIAIGDTVTGFPSQYVWKERDKEFDLDVTRVSPIPRKTDAFKYNKRSNVWEFSATKFQRGNITSIEPDPQAFTEHGSFNPSADSYMPEHKMVGVDARELHKERLPELKLGLQTCAQIISSLRRELVEGKITDRNWTVIGLMGVGMELTDSLSKIIKNICDPPYTVDSILETIERVSESLRMERRDGAFLTRSLEQARRHIEELQEKNNILRRKLCFHDKASNRMHIARSPNQRKR